MKKLFLFLSLFLATAAWSQNQATVHAIKLFDNKDFTVTVNGETVGVPSKMESYAFTLQCGTATGTSPTLDVTIQTSYDNDTWYTLSTAFTQVTTSDAAELVHCDTITNEVCVHPLLPYVRAVGTVGGTTPVINDCDILMWYSIKD